jgi:hypothetical protein
VHHLCAEENEEVKRHEESRGDVVHWDFILHITWMGTLLDNLKATLAKIVQSPIEEAQSQLEHQGFAPSKAKSVLQSPGMRGARSLPRLIGKDRIP